LKDFSKILRSQISKKSFQWEPGKQPDKRTDRDRRTDMTKLIVASRNLTNGPKNLSVCKPM